MNNTSAVTSLFLCKPGFQDTCSHELARTGLAVVDAGPGFVVAEPTGGRLSRAADWCFPVWALERRAVVPGGSVHANARTLFEIFGKWAQGREFSRSWPAVFIPPPVQGREGPLAGVKKLWREMLRERMSRVAKLAVDEAGLGWGVHDGFFAHWDGDAWHVATTAYYGGQARMRDVPGAPSRSFLKIEEAMRVYGRGPGPRESVADLGAAPGGWSLGAARLGAAVTAVDNGPLKGDAACHPNIRHLAADAYTFTPRPGSTFDWLFCDLIDRPERVLGIVERWLTERWCRFYIVNLKLGRCNAAAQLDSLQDPHGPVQELSERFLMRQLYHDRDEITLMGQAKKRH
ncbi:MAG: SAM-dependent methyltransferase [bacterium]